jgi:hypothetical protein
MQSDAIKPIVLSAVIYSFVMLSVMALLSNYGKAYCYANECCGDKLLKEFGTHPILSDSLLILLICITKNTQVFNFTNGHF